MGKFINLFYIFLYMLILLCYKLLIIYIYSRGPNKYTRNWEDEDAYGKTTVPGRGNNRRFQKNNEDFPALGNNKVSVTKYIYDITHITKLIL